MKFFFKINTATLSETFIQNLVFLHPFYLDVTLDLCCLYYPRKLSNVAKKCTIIYE